MKHPAITSASLLLLCAVFCSSQAEARTRYVKVRPGQDLAALIRNARATTAFLLAPVTYKLKP